MISQRGYTCDLAAGQRTSSIKSVRILAGSVEPWNTNGGKDCSRGGGGRKKRKKEGETERNTQINRPFPLVSPLWAERNTDTGQCNRENRRPLFCHISRVLVFWTTIRAGNEWECLLKCCRIVVKNYSMQLPI